MDGGMCLRSAPTSALAGQLREGRAITMPSLRTLPSVLRMHRLTLTNHDRARIRSLQETSRRPAPTFGAPPAGGCSRPRRSAPRWVVRTNPAFQNRRGATPMRSST